MNTEVVNVGIVGTGVGLRTLLPGFRTVREARVVGLVGSTEGRAREFARQHDIPQVFSSYQQLMESSDIDLVCVATPTARHFEEVRYALECGKHVLAEKPLALTQQETRELRDRANRLPQFAVVDHQLRFNPYLRKIRECIRNGTLGRPYFIRMHQQSKAFTKRDSSWTWSFDEQMGGGVRLAMASHLVDLLLFWMGRKAVYHVAGSMDVVVPERKDQQGKSRDIVVSGFFSACLAMEENLEVYLSATAAAVGEARFDIDVYGTDGEIHFDLASKLTGAFLATQEHTQRVSVSGATPAEAENKVSIFKGSFVYFAPLLVQAVLTNTRAPIADAATFEDALRTQVILDAIRESAVSGRNIELAKGYRSSAVL